MSRFLHHSIIVTSWQAKSIQAARRQAQELCGKLVSDALLGVINEQWSFFVAPDGSKEERRESEDCDAERAALLAWLEGAEALGFYLEWVEVRFGADESDPPSSVTRSSDKGRSRAERERPLPPEVLADALQDRIHPTSGRLLSSSPILKPSSQCSTLKEK